MRANILRGELMQADTKLGFVACFIGRDAEVAAEDVFIAGEDIQQAFNEIT